MYNILHKTRFFVLALILVVFGLSINAQDADLKTISGVVRIKLKPELSGKIPEVKTMDGSSVLTGVQALDNMSRKYTATELKRVFHKSPKYEERMKKYGLHLWHEVHYASTADVNAIVQDYKSLDVVQFAEPVYEITLYTGAPVYVNNNDAITYSTTMPFNDPYLPMQWHYDNTGQTGGYAGADINLFDAWNITTGSSDVIVSIHDQGIDYDHEDLYQNMWINEAELNGEPMVDDDGNGYKDDVYGFDFGNNKGSIDPDYHGTHVAGTIGAMNNNGIGVAGVAGGTDSTRGVKMMSCQIFGGVSQGNLPDSYVYAANNGAVISQNSWGYSSSGVYSQAVLDGIDYFIKEAGNYPGSPMKGGIVFFAAGNNNWESDFWPGYYENVISVSALDAKRVKASYSNYGTWVDLAAPGGETRDDAYMPEGQQDAGYSNGILSTFENDSYGYLDGTSMACPHVTGIAALVLSQYGGEGFTPEMLKTHMLTGLTDIDTVVGNENYIGKLGLGLTDAVLALAEDTKLAPGAVSDLAVAGVAQDFVNLEWTVPADADDAIPYSYEVLFSTGPIDETTMEFVKSRTLSNENQLGESVAFEVEGLSGLTTYYFRMRSIDRWGNASELSNEVTTTTNAGPDAWVDKSEFSWKREFVTSYQNESGGWTYVYDTTWYMPIDIDVQVQTSGEDTFYVHNTGEGVLRWEVEQRHVESKVASLGKRQLDPTAPDVIYNDADIKVFGAPFYDTQVLSQEENDEDMNYITPWGARYYFIGETDTAFSNSSATRFTVENPEGFNLTHAEFFLNYESSYQYPAIFEVYIGENINEAELAYSQELYNTSQYWNYFNLEEQIFMEYGTHFWMVIHIPSGNLFPLGASTEENKDDSKNCYISLNMGKSWALFEDLYYDNNIVWAVIAHSMYKTPGEWLSISPTSGEVITGDSTGVIAGTDAVEMINGTYKSNVVIATNETDEPQLRVPTWVTVTGQKPDIKGEPIIDFGSVLYGEEKVVDVTFTNEGFGKFRSARISISDPQFTRTTTSTYIGNINAKSEYTLQLVFKPEAIGNANAVVDIYNSYGDSYQFHVFGVCAEPPVMELAPDSVLFDSVAIGDTLTGEFYLKNTGKFPLNYYLPAFSTGENLGEVSGDFCKYGYSAKDNNGGIFSSPEFVWNDISTTGTSITDYSRDDNHWYYPVEMGFDFPFFGKMENTVHITNYGLVSFDQNSVFNASPLKFKHYSTPDRFISALGKWHDISFGGEVIYQDLGDRFIVQYDKVIYSHYDWWTGKTDYELTFQIVLHADGNINFYYKEFNGAPIWDLTNWTYFAIEDKTTDDGLLLSDQDNQNLNLGNGTAIEITNPGLGLIYEVTNPEGIVQVDDSVRIEFSASTDILNVAYHIEKMPILTNDPFNNPGIFELHINVTDGGVANITLNDTVFDYGQVFQNDIIEYALWVVNTGRANDTLETAVFKNGYFTLTGDIPAVLSPNRKMIYTLQVNSANLGVLQDTLTLTTANGDVFKVALNAEIIEAPQIITNVSSIKDTLAWGDVATHTITVTNNGGNDLEFAAIGNDWLTVAEASVMALEVPEFTYTFTRSENEGGPTYIWEELYQTGTKVDSIDPWGYEGWSIWSKGIKLPFSFNYYGVDYDTVYVGYNGVVTFTKTDERHAFGANGVFPTADEPNNLIAPLWGFIYTAWYIDESGVYYTADSEKITIEWYKYVDAFYMGQPISFQLILYADGNIKFQYNMEGVDFQSATAFSGIGLENQDGTDGVTVGFGQYDIVGDGTAVVFSPVKKNIIAPGASTDLLVTLNAKEIYAGDFAADLLLLNNTPDTGNYVIPVQLHVTGEAQMTYPDSLNFGAVQATGTTYTQEFEMKNEGSKRLEILDFITTNVAGSTIQAWVLGTDWMGNPMWTWMNVNNLPMFDWMTGTNIPLYIEPNSSMKFRVDIAPTTIDAIADTLIISTDIASTPELQLRIYSDPIFPPVLSIAEESIDIYAPVPTHTEERTFYINNKEGQSDLNYEMGIEFIRDTEETSTYSSDASGTYAVASIPELEEKTISGAVAEVKTNSITTLAKYNRVLEHDTASYPEMSLGYGGSLQFQSATKFTAPENGFNLTHVETWYVPGEWLESKIVVEILAGVGDINNATVIHTQEYFYTIDAPDFVGAFLSIALDENQIFFPGEDFFVVFKYPTAAQYPQGTALINEPIEGRFMFGDGSAWFDIVGSGYDNYGWMVKAGEMEFATAVWAEITSELSGTVPAGDSVAINMSFNAGFAEYGVNKAELTILSNDYSDSEHVIPVTLSKNSGPMFSLGNNISVSVKENETLNLDIIATDAEGDNFTLSMAQIYDFVSANYNAGVLNFSYSPDFESAGLNSFEVKGEDEHGNTNSFMINVEVVNVNRAPEALTLNTVELIENGDNFYGNVSELFSDPDGDEFSLTSFTIADTSICKAYGDGNDFILVPAHIGTTTATFTVSDTYGSEGTLDLTVNVVGASGINDIISDGIQIYPNPTGDYVQIDLANVNSNVSLLRIVNVKGAVVYEVIPENTLVRVDLVEMAPGAYYLEVINSDETIRELIIKK